MNKTLQILATFALLFLLSINTYANLPGYGFYKALTIQSSQVAGAGSHTDFPILVSHTDPDLRSTANGGNVENINGYDIRFTASDGTTLLDHQLEDYNPVTGEIAFWVKIPSLSTSVNTIIRVYYGNATVFTDSSVPTVWDANYMGVWHLNDNEQDGTTNTNNLTSTGTTNAPGSKIADGQSFSFNEKLTSGNQPELQILGDVTVEAWVNFSTFQVGIPDNSIIGYGDPNLTMADNHSYKLNVQSTGFVRAFWEYGAGNAESATSTIPGAFALGGWNHIAFTRDVTANTVRFYLNGNQLGGAVGYTNDPNGGTNGELFIGEGFPGYDLDGIVDEARVSNIVRSTDWLSTSYNSMDNPSTFYTIGIQMMPPPLPDWCWAEDALAGGNEEFLDVVTQQSTGNSYAVGYFNGDLSAEFPMGLNGTPDMSSTAGNEDGLVVKYDFSGNPIWAFKIGSSGSTVRVHSSAIDANGNIYITGEFDGTNVEFQGVSTSILTSLTSSGGSDVFIAKYNSNGELQWVDHGSGAGGTDVGSSIAVSANGVYITGWFQQNMFFGGVPVSHLGGGNQDAFIVKYSLAGIPQWATVAGADTGGGFRNQRGLGISSDGTNVYVIGVFFHTISVGSLGTINNYDSGGNTRDIWIASINENTGAANWANRIGSTAGDEGTDIDVYNGKLYITGSIDDNGTVGVNFPGTASVVTGNSGEEIFLAQIDATSATTDWVSTELSIGNDDNRGESVKVDTINDIVYTTGYFNQTTNFNFGADPKVSGGGSDVFVMARNTLGNYLWTLVGTDNNDMEGNGISIDALGGVYVAGMMDNQGTFGALPVLGDAGGDDAFIAKINCTTPSCSTSVVCPTNDTVTANTSCQYIVTDYTSSAVTFASCGIDSVHQFPAVGDTVESGVTPITIYLTDSLGNVDSCVFNLVVEANVNPTVVTCGDILIGETTIGQVNNTTNFSCVGFNTPGEDAYYQLTVPAGNYWLQIGLDNVVDSNDSWVETFWVGGNCPLGGSCIDDQWYDINTQQFSGGGNSIQYLAVGPGTYYFVVDAQNDGIESYDIRFDCLESGIEFDTSATCGDPNNDGVIPYLNGSSVNLTTQTCDNDTFCHDLYIANRQEAEWVDSVYMQLGPCYENVVPTNVAGFYQPGTWVGNYNNTNNTISWQFNNTANPVWGDGSGTKYACDSAKTRLHTLCFTADISSTCAADSNLNVGIFIFDDAVAGSGSSVPGMDYELSEQYIISNPSPTISCPANQVVNNDAGLCGAQVNGIAPVALGDNCPNPFVTYTLSGATSGSGANDASGTTFNLGVTTVQYIISDSTGFTDTCQFTVTVIDNENPTITCPSSIVVNSTASCAAVVNGIAPVGVNDNCAIDSINYKISGATSVPSGLNDASGTTFNVGTSTVVYVITDSAGNIDTCSFTVTVNDAVAPTITCPTNVSISCPGIVNNIAPVSTNDDCAIDSVNYVLGGATTGSGLNDASGTFFNSGVTTVTYTVTDLSGNTASCNFTVTVNDAINPTISCPSNQNISCPGVINGIAPLSANDNCAIDSVNYVLSGATAGSGLNDASGTFFNSGITTVTYTVTDLSGNTASCNFTVTVNDAINPTISCPSNQNISCPGVINGIAPLSANDNCAIDSVNYVLSGATAGSGLNDASGTFFNSGITTVTYTVTDLSGNTASCNFTVTVNDAINPTISCPADTTLNTDPGVCSALVNGIAPLSANDNCAIDSISYVLSGATTGSGLNDASGIIFNEGLTTVTYTVTDSSGNMVSCNFTITVVDNELPTIVCPSNVTVNNDPGDCEADVFGLTPTLNDNCGIASLNHVMTGATIDSDSGDASGEEFNVGVTTVTYYVVDINGNTDSCSFTVTVNDVEAPTISCPGNQTVSNDAGVCTAVVNGISPSNISDNCAIDSVSYILTGATTGTGPNDASGITFNSGVTQVTYIVYDVAGNSDSCNFTITVLDNELPVVTCPSNVSQASNSSSCSATVNNIAPLNTSDNCAIDSVNYVLSGATSGSGLNDASGTSFNAGITNVTYIITDQSGNIDSCSFTVTIYDSIAPTISCPSSLIVSNDPGFCSALINGIAPISPNDNCAIDSVSYVLSGATSGSGISDASGTNFNVGVTTITYYVYDLSGNVDSCSFTVTVNDTEAPTISCPSNQTVSNDVGMCSAILNSIAPINLGDNCAIDSVSYVLSGATNGNGLNDASGISFNVGITSLTYVVYDMSGNADSCTFTITVDDNELPSINCPAPIVICDTFVTVPLPNFSDNCKVDSIYNDFNGTNDATGIYPYGITTVNWTIIDSSGNINTCSTTIEVEKEPTAYAGEDQILYGVNSTYFTATGIGTWSIISGYGNILNTNNPTSYVDALETGQNIFEWTVKGNVCPDAYDDVMISYYELTIPNGFSPNGDGDNDYFEIKGIDLLENEVVIFNRWGVELYTSANYQNDWDGRSNDGKDLPEDTYFYIVKIPGLNKELSGYVVLKR